MRFDVHTRALATAMSAALVLIPGLLQAGIVERQATAAPRTEKIETRTIEVPIAFNETATSRIEARVHDGRATFHIDITSGDEHAAVDMDGNHVTLPDGFGVDLERLPAAAGERAARITATAPDGRIEHAIVHVDTTTGAHREAGVERVIALINEAPSAHLLRETLPAIGRAMQAHAAEVQREGNIAAGTPHFGRVNTLDVGDVVAEGIWGCMGAGILVVGSFFLAGAACLMPEPLEPLACIGALIVLAGAVVVWLDACGFI